MQMVHSVSEFTHSFLFTPQSELYEWTSLGSSERGYRGRFLVTAAVMAQQQKMWTISLREAGI